LEHHHWINVWNGTIRSSANHPSWLTVLKTLSTEDQKMLPATGQLTGDMEPDSQCQSVHVANPGFAAGQLARALSTAQQQTHTDPTTRERAKNKIERWTAALHGMLSGNIHVGTRTPVAATPAWATLEVLHGGFASGRLLAKGELLLHEQSLAQELAAAEGCERAVINQHYLTDVGFAELQSLLSTGKYRIGVPEEGALLVVVWLAEQGLTEKAQQLLESLGPFLRRLRFYPVPAARPISLEHMVSRQTVGDTIGNLKAVAMPLAMAREREALLIWAPIHDEVIQLFCETVEGVMPFVVCDDAMGTPLRKADGAYIVNGGWPCQCYPDGWHQRAVALLARFQQLRTTHRLVQNVDNSARDSVKLRSWLRQCSVDSSTLSGYQVGAIRRALAAVALRRGLPSSQRLDALRSQQYERCTAPTRHDMAQLLIARLQAWPQDEGLRELAAAMAPVSCEEAQHWSIPADTMLPAPLLRKVERCLEAPLSYLVEHGMLPSAEAMAAVIPVLSASIHVSGFHDVRLRQLYQQLYTAFRRRRSLIMLNLQHQVQFEELPWVRHLLESAPRITTPDPSQFAARDLLVKVVTLTLTTFPQQILPNPLLREISALAKRAGFDVSITEEIAADIFMGTFTAKYLLAAKQAAFLLSGSVYERYYGVDYQHILQIEDKESLAYGTPVSEAFVGLCYERAGPFEQAGWYSVAANGRVIEQQQILTTHNLAPLIHALGLRDALDPQLETLTQACFRWICVWLQCCGKWRVLLHNLKNSAYAWRQMIVFLSLMPVHRQLAWHAWAAGYLNEQPAEFRERFAQALQGLRMAIEGQNASLDDPPFVGWTTERHWLMPQKR
jgi:hypothetical protein